MRQVGGEFRQIVPAPTAPGAGLAHPAPRPLPARLPPVRPRRRPAKITRLGLAALAGLIAYAAATDAGRQVRSGPGLVESLDRLALAAGFGIAQIEISGHVHTSDKAIEETLDLAHAGSLLGLDSVALRQRIERLPWIDTASVTRVFPDRLQIVVSERTPFARWQRGERTLLIDATGRILTAIAPGSARHLPLVAGEGAAEAAAALLDLLARYPEILARLDTAERVDGRRWTLHLEGGPVFVLPADAEAEALARLGASGVLALQSVSRVDARAPDRLIVHREGGRAPLPPPAASLENGHGRRG